MKTFADTQIGLVRKKNEDRYLIKKMNDGSVLLAVADGMGGEPAGDVAAEIIISKLSAIKPDSVNIIKMLVNLANDANRAILDEVEKDSSLMGMGATLTCALLKKGTVHWVHVGDSRLYHVRENRLLQITRDQNMAQFLLEEGEINCEEARCHPSRNHLDQCVGCEDCEPVSGSFEIKEGDLIILSTDGLHNEVENSTMESLMLCKCDIQTKAKLLFSSALEAGGKDNITIVIAEI
jgi:protein phosphatase